MPTQMLSTCASDAILIRSDSKNHAPQKKFREGLGNLISPGHSGFGVLRILLAFFAASLGVVTQPAQAHVVTFNNCPALHDGGSQSLSVTLRAIDPDGNSVDPKGLLVVGTTVYFDINAVASGGYCQLQIIPTGQSACAANGGPFVRRVVIVRADMIEPGVNGWSTFGALGAATPVPQLTGTLNTTLFDHGHWRFQIKSSMEDTPCTLNGNHIPESEIKEFDIDVVPKCPSCTSDQMVGNPVDTAYGNKHEHERDLWTDADGLGFERDYNSSVAIDVGLGMGWTSRYQTRLFVQGIRAIVLDSNGYASVFTKSGTIWTPDADIKNRLTQTGQGYEFRYPSGAKDVYNLQGYLVSITNAAGRTTVVNRDVSNQITSVVGPFGHQVGFSYTNGHITAITGPGGALFTYGYDTSQRLSFATYPDGSVHTYFYENAQFPFNLTGITDGNGVRFSTYAYDGAGRATLTQHSVTTNAVPQESFSLVYDLFGNATATDAAGTVKTYSFSGNLGAKRLDTVTTLSDSKFKQYLYDAQNNPYKITDEEGRSTYNVFNATNQTTQMTEAFGTANARTTNFSYLSTDLFLPTQVQRPSVRAGLTAVTTTTYQGNQPLTITQSGYTPTGAAISRAQTFTYDTSGRVLTSNGARTDVSDITTYTYNTCTTGAGCGQINKITNALGQATTYDTYDGAGRVTQITDPNGLKTILQYDPRGRLAKMTRRATGMTDQVTSMTYDPEGQLKKIVRPDGSLLNYGYDAAHYLVSITDSAGNAQTFTYDALGRRTNTTVKDPSAIATKTMAQAYDIRSNLTQLNDGGVLTNFTNDATGLKKTEADSASHTSTSGYDYLKRLTSVTDALSGVTSYQYDVNDRATQVTDPRGLITQYAYDDLGNVITQLSPDTGATQYSYDAAGNRITRTDARSVTSTYAYDALNRLKSVTYPNTSENVTYFYDGTNYSPSAPFGIGRLTGITDETGVTKIFYDVRGNVIKESKVIQSVTYNTTYTYDLADHLTSMTYPSGRVVNYPRNTLGEVSQVSSVLSGTTTTLANTVVHRPFGPVASFTMGSGIAVSRSFDLGYRVTDLTNGTALKRHLNYDTIGNVSSISDLLNSGESQTFQYDALNRLTQATGGYGNLTYGYDADGNRISSSNVTGSIYAYGLVSNRLLSVVGLNPAVFAYDAAGNAVQKGLFTFTYNQASRPIQVFNTAISITTQRYNALGERVTKTASGSTTIAHYDRDGRLIAETTSAGAVVREYVYLDGEPLAMFTGGQPYYLHNDHLGTPQRATSAGGVTSWQARIAPFGETQPQVQTITQPLRMPGQYADSLTGLSQNWFRDYDPAVGRYLESDPIGQFGGLNTYVYVQSNPLRWVDRKGQGIELIVPAAIIGYSCFELYCVKRGINGCEKKYPGHTNPFSSDYAAFAKCQQAVVTVCATLGAFGQDPLGAAASEAGGHVGSQNGGEGEQP